MSLDYQNTVEFSYDSLDEAFPPCDPCFRPTGNRVLVQLRTPKKKTKGGIILTADVRDTEHYNTQVGKVLAMGNLTFRNHKDGQLWPEGEWFTVGDYIRVPRYGADRWTVKIPGAEEDEEAVLILVKDTDVGGVYTGDPTAVKAFL